MDNTIYIGLSQQMMLFRDLDVTANNLANVNTPGFSAEKLRFASYLVKNGSGHDAYADDPASYRETSPGSLTTTRNPFDMAINGHAYFQVQTPLGVRYTKAGNFQVNDQGALVTTDGYPVLGSDGGEINLPVTAKSVVINGAGQINADGEDAGQVGMMEFKDEQGLTRLGNSLYSSKESPEPSESARLVQGAVEQSNVNPVNELTRVLYLSRAVSDSAKFNDTYYQLKSKAAQVYSSASGQAS